MKMSDRSDESDLSPLLTEAEAAELLHLNDARALRRIRERREIDYLRFGKKTIRYMRSQLREYIERQTQKAVG